MKIHRAPQMISGFVYEEPVDEIPALTHCGEALCCRGHTVLPHVHTGFEFHYLLRGTCYWQAVGQKYCQKMGDMMIFHPGVRHNTGVKQNPENHHLWLGVRLRELGPRGIHLERQILRHGVWILTGFQEVELLMNAILGQVVSTQRHRDTVISSLLAAFIEILEQRIDISSRPERNENSLEWPYSFAIKKVVAYMKQNLDRRIPLKDLADLASMRNTAHFCTLFCREVGQTPASYHVHMRLQAAKEALSQPSAKITTVAYQFGFSSSQHFSTQFHRQFGVTPKQCKTNKKKLWWSAKKLGARKVND